MPLHCFENSRLCKRVLEFKPLPICQGDMILRGLFRTSEEMVDGADLAVGDKLHV